MVSVGPPRSDPHLPANLRMFSSLPNERAANLRHNMLSTFLGCRDVLLVDPEEVHHAGDCHFQDRTPSADS